MYRRLSELLAIPVIASGGAGCVEDIVEVLSEGRADAALAASIFHYDQIKIGELKKQLRSRGIETRTI